jgi:hypothetical protein
MQCKMALPWRCARGAPPRAPLSHPSFQAGGLGAGLARLWEGDGSKSARGLLHVFGPDRSEPGTGSVSRTHSQMSVKPVGDGAPIGTTGLGAASQKKSPLDRMRIGILLPQRVAASCFIDRNPLPFRARIGRLLTAAPTGSSPWSGTRGSREPPAVLTQRNPAWVRFPPLVFRSPGVGSKNAKILQNPNRAQELSKLLI